MIRAGLACCAYLLLDLTLGCIDAVQARRDRTRQDVTRR